jgi:predicted transcriptional regulator
MATTTSLKLPESLKSQIAWLAEKQGKTAHALMVETLQQAMDDAQMREQFYDDADAAEQEADRTNIGYKMQDVHAYFRARARGLKPDRPQPVAIDPSKPMRPDPQ